MARDIEIDIAVHGTCVTRNGESPIGRMTACVLEGGQVDVRFVSERLRRRLHAGARIGAGDLDIFCEAWLRVRGHPLNAGIRDLDRAKRLGAELFQLLGKL